MPGFIFLVVLGGAYAALYYLNHKTPVPAGCEEELVSCGGCQISSCGRHPVHSLEVEN